MAEVPIGDVAAGSATGVEDVEPVFVRPALGWFVVLDGGLATLAVLALSRRAYEKARDVVPLPEQPQLRALLAGAVGLHAVEAVVGRSMARRRGVPPGPWTRQTFVVGFPSLLRLRAVPRR